MNGEWGMGNGSNVSRERRMETESALAVFNVVSAFLRLGLCDGSSVE